jgi:hypothetical protein
LIANKFATPKTTGPENSFPAEFHLFAANKFAMPKTCESGILFRVGFQLLIANKFATPDKETVLSTYPPYELLLLILLLTWK